MNMMPRLRGNAIEVEGGWGWQFCVTFMGDGDEGLTIESKEVFKTKDVAIADMKRAIKEACDAIQESAQGHATGEYIDMKTNKLRKWDGSSEH
jgi:hypothetical protein